MVLDFARLYAFDVSFVRFTLCQLSLSSLALSPSICLCFCSLHSNEYIIKFFSWFPNVDGNFKLLSGIFPCWLLRSLFRSALGYWVVDLVLQHT